MITPTFSKTSSIRKRRLNTAQLSDEKYQDLLQADLTVAFGEGLNDDEAPSEEWKGLSTKIFNTGVGILG